MVNTEIKFKSSESKNHISPHCNSGEYFPSLEQNIFETGISQKET